MATTADDNARLLISIEATQAKFNKQLAAIAGRAARTAKGIEDDFTRANGRAGQSFEKGGAAAVSGLNRGRAAAQNLSFQLNDIATQLASGTSPFTVMAQQGGQVAQALNSAGGPKAALSALGGAVTGLLNPVGLLSVALIGLTGYAVKYFAEWASSGKATAKEIEDQAKLIERVADRWGDSVPALRQYADELKRAREEREKVAAFDALREQSYEPSKAGANTIRPDFAAVRTDLQQIGADAQQIDRLQVAWDNLTARLAAHKAETQDVTAVQSALAAVLGGQSLQSANDLSIALDALAKKVGVAADKNKTYTTQQNTTNATMLQAKELAVGLLAQMSGLGDKGVDAVVDVARAFSATLLPNLQQAIDKTGELIRQYQAIQNQVNDTPLGALSPVYSNNGQFLGSDGNALQRPSSAMQLIRDKEQFREKAYWDVNAWRTGYGSDTVTRADGTIERVTQATIVTLADAERDLSRRIAEFQNGIQRAISPEVWSRLTEGQQAALTSIAYNYGSLPKKISDAIKKGGGPDEVARAIQSLGVDNDGINRARRNDEAEIYLGGKVPLGPQYGPAYNPAQLARSGGAPATPKKTPDDLFKGSMEQVQQRIDLYNKEAEAESYAAAGWNDYGFAVEKARIKQELLNDAQRAGKEVTPDLAKQIDRLAENYAKAATQGEVMAAKQRAIQDEQRKTAETAQQAAAAQQQWADLASTAIEGIGSALQDGKITAEEWLQIGFQILQQMIQMKSAAGGINFGGGGSGGGLLGGLFSLFGFATGGIAAYGKPLALPRFAGGGVSRSAAIFGEAEPEAAVPLPDGRRIPVDLRMPTMPEIPTARSRGGSQDRVDIVIADPAGLMQGVAERVVQSRAGTIVRIAVEQGQKATRQNMGGLMANAQMRQL